MSLELAAKTYLERQARESHPEGTFDSKKRWYPDEAEHCNCCSSIRQPSAAYPFTIMTHCRSITHIASLHQVKESDLKIEIKKIRKQSNEI